MMTQLALAAFYRQLATMLDAGVSVVRALETLERSAPTSLLRNISARLRQRITDGGDLSDGLASHEATFPALHREMIRVGEQSGSLDRQLRQLAELLDQYIAVRREVWSGLAYPLLVLHLALLLAPLPRLISAGVGGYLSAVAGSLIVLYAAVAIGWWIARQIQRDQARLSLTDRLVLVLPMIGKIHRDLSLARLFTTLRALLNAGIGILEALPRAGAACGSALLAEAAREAVPQLQRGEPLVVAMAAALPPDALSMISTGQESGRLDQMLLHLEKHFFDESRRRLRAMANWLPKLIYFGVVLWVAWQILQMAFGYSRLLSDALNE
jgi:type IV pilus assembly protein PilC